MMMYFAILGKHKELSLKELEYAQPTKLQPAANQQMVLFETCDEGKLAQLAGIIKRGKLISGELSAFFASCEKRILGVADKNQGINLKKQYGLKRFKQVDLFHTDLEVKKKGVELIKIGSQRGQVLGYQQIRLYEVVDFEKPGRSMQMGMMPAKLTHLLLNIGLSLAGEEQPLIYDPFVGSGTTGFLANHFGFNFLGSDLKLTFAEKNLPWWKESKWAQQNLTFEFFLHDATKALDHKEKFGTQTPVIITEGWLGPVIKATTIPEEVKEYQRRVKNVYLPWIEQMATAFPKKPVMVFTIPWYLGYENLLEKAIIELCEQVGFRFSSLQELYKREQHKVARKVIMLQ
ncbi:MAG: hypothetical protein DLD55_03100 [candidate division SR1 bacterium]|nr:MAG: hypothetical protein DLD55_03100 [candidate division SR1 bacterium]